MQTRRPNGQFGLPGIQAPPVPLQEHLRGRWYRGALLGQLRLQFLQGGNDVRWYCHPGNGTDSDPPCPKAQQTAGSWAEPAGSIGMRALRSAARGSAALPPRHGVSRRCPGSAVDLRRTARIHHWLPSARCESSSWRTWTVEHTSQSGSTITDGSRASTGSSVRTRISLRHGWRTSCVGLRLRGPSPFPQRRNSQRS